MKRPALIISLLTAIVIISVAFSAPPEVRYKNLKVLPKNTTKAQMDTIMNHFSRSLGVRCNFCHIRANDGTTNMNFASDSNNHKIIARNMMKMTNKLNKKYFKDGGKEKGAPLVTCYSCHNGKEEPATIPPAPPARRQPQPGTQPATQASTTTH